MPIFGEALAPPSPGPLLLAVLHLPALGSFCGWIQLCLLRVKDASIVSSKPTKRVSHPHGASASHCASWKTSWCWHSAKSEANRPLPRNSQELLTLAFWRQDLHCSVSCKAQEKLCGGFQHLVIQDWPEHCLQIKGNHRINEDHIYILQNLIRHTEQNCKRERKSSWE